MREWEWLIVVVPCDETALDRAKSILFATIMTGRVRIKSKSCSDINSCSTRVYDALSTHEYTKMNASALIYSSYACRQKHAHNKSIQFTDCINIERQTGWCEMIANEMTKREWKKKKNKKKKMKMVFDCLKDTMLCCGEDKWKEKEPKMEVKRTSNLMNK